MSTARGTTRRAARRGTRSPDHYLQYITMVNRLTTHDALTCLISFFSGFKGQIHMQQLFRILLAVVEWQFSSTNISFFLYKCVYTCGVVVLTFVMFMNFRVQMGRVTVEVGGNEWSPASFLNNKVTNFNT